MTHEITLSSNTIKHLMQITNHLLKDSQEVQERLRKEHPELDVSDVFIFDFYDSVKEFRSEVLNKVHYSHWLEFDPDDEDTTD